jgi:hypothetical protein
MKKEYFIVIFTLFTSYLFSQPWLKNLPKNKANGELTFFDYQNASNTYWKPFNVNKGFFFENGEKIKAVVWKQFKRWEYNMETQVNQTNGEFPLKSAQLVYKEFLLTNAYKSTTSTASWTLQLPISSTSGNAGIGRINCIAFHPSYIKTFVVTDSSIHDK